MKKLRYLLTACLSWAVLTVCGQSPYAPIIVPHLPDELDFAGERVPLENFDTRESLQRELLTTLYMHSRTALQLLRAERYFSVIDPILAEYEIPADFRYLCVAESGLDPEVVSPAGAAGLWQLMPAVGRSFGLVTCKGVDERYHVEKATEAACRLLRENYEALGSWTLAAAAYNLGRSGVQRRITEQGVDDYYDAFFPLETLRYMFRILAYKLLFQDPSAYGYDISAMEVYKPLDEYRTVHTGPCTEIAWSEFAHRYGTTFKMLRLLNPWIRDYHYRDKTAHDFAVKVPVPGFRR